MAFGARVYTHPLLACASAPIGCYLSCYGRVFRCRDTRRSVLFSGLSEPQVLLAMSTGHHQGSRPVHVDGVQGFGWNWNLNMELHYRSRFFLANNFLGTYSSRKSSVARQRVDPEFLVRMSQRPSTHQYNSARDGRASKRAEEELGENHEINSRVAVTPYVCSRVTSSNDTVGILQCKSYQMAENCNLIVDQEQLL